MFKVTSSYRCDRHRDPVQERDAWLKDCGIPTLKGRTVENKRSFLAELCARSELRQRLRCLLWHRILTFLDNAYTVYDHNVYITFASTVESPLQRLLFFLTFINVLLALYFW